MSQKAFLHRTSEFHDLWICFSSLQHDGHLASKGLWVQPSQDVGPWEKVLTICFVVTGKLTWMIKSWMEKYLLDDFPTSYSHRISVWIYSSRVQWQLLEWTCEPNYKQRHVWRHCVRRVMAPNYDPLPAIHPVCLQLPSKDDIPGCFKISLSYHLL